MINLNKYMYDLMKNIFKFFKKVKSKLLPTYIEKETMRWERDGGDFELRFNYNLDENSIVFDLGGFKGNFSSDLYARMPCKIYIFEPIKKYHLIIKNRFKLNNMIKIFPYGLSDKTESNFIEIKGECSSTFINKYENYENKTIEKIKLFDIDEFIEEKNINKIDLMKINIEGGEYNVIQRLIEKNKVQNIKYLQIQFHILDKKSKIKRDYIRKLLQKTHNCEYCYEFVWENWIRKNN